MARQILRALAKMPSDAIAAKAAGVARRPVYMLAIQIRRLPKLGMTRPYSAARCASFTAIEGFIKKTRTMSATATTAKMKKTSK